MTDETDIDISSLEASAPEGSVIKPKAQKRFGLITLLGAMFLSSAFGAGVIGLISHFNKAAVPDLAPLSAKVENVSAEAESLATENRTLKAQITRLQRDIKKASKPVTIDLTPLENRVRDLEEAEPKEIDPELLTRLEALQNEGSEALDLSDILARLEALENRPIATARSLESVPQLEMNPPIDFPSEAILASLEKPGGWLKQSLKKHISVQSDANPRYLVDVIKTNIDAGDIEAAIVAFEKLPAEAQAAGQAWHESLNR